MKRQALTGMTMPPLIRYQTEQLQAFYASLERMRPGIKQKLMRDRQARTVVSAKKAGGNYCVVEVAPVANAKTVYIVSAYMAGRQSHKRTASGCMAFIIMKTSFSMQVRNNPKSMQ